MITKELAYQKISELVDRFHEHYDGFDNSKKLNPNESSD